jgi:hypothetical protein
MVAVGDQAECAAQPIYLPLDQVRARYGLTAYSLRKLIRDRRLTRYRRLGDRRRYLRVGDLEPWLAPGALDDRTSPIV